MPRLPYKNLAPDAYNALIAMGHYLNTETALEPALLGLIYLRVSLRNRCGFCIGLHTAELQHLHQPQSRIDAVASFDTPEHRDAFTPRERAALAGAATSTDIQQTHAPDAAYAAVSEFFAGKDLVDLTFAITTINSWNRLGIAFGLEWNPPARRSSPATAEAPAPVDLQAAIPDA
jgi:AhpD family alkylhydroperoxidase